MTDFADALDELGITEEDLNDTLSTQIREHGMADVYTANVALIGSSKIHRLGAFAEVSQPRGHLFLPVRLGKQMTRIGCYVNHSSDPNTKMIHFRNGDLYLKALRWINPLDEITQDYRVAEMADAE